MAKRKRYKPKSLVKDIATFTTGGLIVGAGASAIGGMGAGAAGTHAAAGMASVGQGMGTVAPIMMMKHQIGGMSLAMEQLNKIPSMKSRRKRNRR